MIIQLIKPIHKKSQFQKIGIFLLSLAFLLSLYAPFLASEQPFIELHNKGFTFPFFNSLFSTTHYRFALDRFLNALALLCPIGYFLKGFRTHFFIRRSLFFGFILTIFLLSSFSSKTQIKINSRSSVRLTPLIAHGPEKMILKSSKHFQVIELKSQSGQSLWAKVLFGMRYSFSLALLSCLLAFCLGMIWGTLSGYWGGLIDQVMCRLLEIWDSMPTILIVLVFVQFLAHASFFFKASLLALLSFSSIARVVRLDILKHKCLPFVDVLRNLELHPFIICTRHLLPCTFQTLIVLFPFALVGTITFESAFSFMGIGQLDRPSLGRLIEEAKMSYPLDSALFWPPAALLFISLIGLILLGETLKKEIENL